MKGLNTRLRFKDEALTVSGCRSKATIMSINIGIFDRGVGTQTGRTEVQRGTFDLGSFVAGIGENAGERDQPKQAKVMDVTVSFILDKLVEHGLITEAERKELEKKVKNMMDLLKALEEMKAAKNQDKRLAEALRTATGMSKGKLLSNGILTHVEDPQQIERLASLSAEDVHLIETVTGADTAIGQGSEYVTALARSREAGIINGPLGLKDFATLKFVCGLDENSNAGELIRQRIKALYDMLLAKEQQGGSAWSQQTVADVRASSIEHNDSNDAGEHRDFAAQQSGRLGLRERSEDHSAWEDKRKDSGLASIQF